MRTTFIFLFLIAVLSSCQQPSSTNNQPPNIIIVLTDDLGYGDLSCYRELHDTLPDKPTTTQTPNIDNLASEGMMFTDFYSGNAVCSPSRAAISTGRNNNRVGIYNWIPPNTPMHLRKSETTIAEMLKQKDYQTGHFGKWHLSSDNINPFPPNVHGFDYSFYTFNNAEPSHENPVNFMRNGDAVGPMQGYSCQLVVDEAMGWLDTIQNQKPFYINVWFHEPHEKVAAPDSLVQKHPYKGTYYGAIENMDKAFGRLMSYLKEKNLDDNTIVMFASDNGSQEVYSNWPLRGEKCFNWEGGIRSPYIIRWPNHIKAGSMSQAAGSFVDILPTIASLTETSLPENTYLDGVDLTPAIIDGNNTFKRKKPVFHYRYFHDPICMLREGDWILLGYEQEPEPFKINYSEVDQALIKPGEGEPKWAAWGYSEMHMEYIKKQKINFFELYNIKDDIMQKNDISEAHPEKVETMKASMIKLKNEMVEEGGNWYK